MERLFPRALLACIGESRVPRPHELMEMAEKVRREAFPHEHDSSARQMAFIVAHVAMTGTLDREDACRLRD